MFRSVLFWAHLVCGVIAGFAIFTMCLTGVLLTYERQIEDWVATSGFVPEAEQVNRLSLDELSAIALAQNPGFAEGTLAVDRNPGAPVVFRQGRQATLPLNPYSGEQMEPAHPWVDELFGDLIGFHRWFNYASEDRRVPRLITGVSNLMFVFIILSGIYLWLPKIWNWAVVRARLLLHRDGYATSKARDFTWHHVFGIWCAIPLLILAVTGSMFSFRWTGDLLFSAFGTDRSGSNLVIETFEPNVPFVSSSAFQDMDSLLESAAGYSDQWQEIILSMPQGEVTTVTATVDRGNGRRPQLRNTLTLNRNSGEILHATEFGSLPINQQVRSVYRFLHTGEFLGILGQTLAGVVSFFGLLMVWTGLALAYRRLLQPLIQRRSTIGAIAKQDPAQS